MHAPERLKKNLLRTYVVGTLVAAILGEARWRWWQTRWRAHALVPWEVRRYLGLPATPREAGAHLIRRR